MERSSQDSGRFIDPVTAEYMKGVDITLLRENLKLTPQQRFEKMERAIRDIEELREVGRKYRANGTGNAKTP